MMLAEIGRDPPIESDFVYRRLPLSLYLMSMQTGLPFGLDWETCDRARLARDPAFDGAFFTGVLTTRIYCRPVFPVRPAKSENVRFFATAAAAERAGFRPCLRCRPETAPGSPQHPTVQRRVSCDLRAPAIVISSRDHLMLV